MTQRITPVIMLMAFMIVANAHAAADPPFGGKQDVAFAQALWPAIAHHDRWLMQSDVYPGQSPHGKFLRVYANVVTVEGKPYHVIIKDNYGAEDASIASVTAHPADHLLSVTVMVQREAGYDPDHDDLFWVKFAADGNLVQTPQGAAMAGRVAAGTTHGCIACHGKAGGHDFMYTNDGD